MTPRLPRYVRARLWRVIVSATLATTSLVPPATADETRDLPSEAVPAAPDGAPAPSPAFVAESAADPATERKRLEKLRRSENAFHQGLSSQQHGDAEEAIAAYRRALRLDGDFVEARVNLARVLFEQGDLAGAQREIDRALEAQPRYAGAFAVRALIRWKQSKWVGARADLERALGLDPELTEARVNLGALALRLGELDAAREALDEAMLQAPKRPEVVFNRALLEDSSGAYGEALYFYSLYLDLAPSDDPLRPRVLERAQLLASGASRDAESSQH